MNCDLKRSYGPSYEVKESFKLHPFGEITQLTHKKSGAHLVLVKNKDQARCFTAAFKTPPYDDTGLFHIFEHAVLAGSRLYPSKSNFKNVSSSTVATFINAFTGSVNTWYPFITRNSKDFNNLLSVYMDAVFFPNILKDPRIMYREGWRYEVHPETKKMSINGIVFSEMKGNLSKPYELLWLNMGRAFLPNTPYAYSSAGIPEKISELRFEQITDAHKKYYHPQNSLISLYGDLDFKKTLSDVDEFLKHFDKDPHFQTPEIPLQGAFDKTKPSVIKAAYPGKKGNKKDFLAKGYVLGELKPLEEDALPILTEAFVSNSVSPLKLRTLKENLAHSTFSLKFGRNSNAVVFVFEGTDSSKKGEIEKVIQEEIDKVIQEGLDQELLISILNRFEFWYKETNNNAAGKGYYLISRIKNHWLFPKRALIQELDTINQFKKLRQLFKDQSFVKKFFQTQFKDNKNTRWLIMEPDPQFSESFNKAIAKKVEAALELKPLSEYEKEDKEFREWVSAKEASEILEKTPLLEISDFKKEEAPIPFKEIKKDSYKLIEYPRKTSGVSYIRLFFDLKGVEEKNLKKLRLFIKTFGETDTRNYPFKKLSKQIDTFIGNIRFAISSYQSAKNPEQFKPFMTVNLSFLDENREKSLSLLKEILLHSQFSPKDRIQNILDEFKTEKMNSIPHRGSVLSSLSARKSFFPLKGGFRDELEGGAFEDYISKLKIEPEKLMPEFQSLLSQIFNQKRMYLVTLTAESNQLKSLNKEIEKLKISLPEQSSEDRKWLFSEQKNYKAYAIPAEVQYLTEVTSFKDQGLEFSGVLNVYSQYLDTNFMTPRFREQNGAYGAWNYFQRNGLWVLASYRDPHLKKSFDSFSQAVKFMKEENLNPNKLKPAILGSLKPFYSDRSVSGKANFMTQLYLRDLTWDDYMQTKKEILETKAESFQKINRALEQALQKSQKAVAGNADKIKKEATFVKEREILSLP
ncbi:MAG: insulinase family protein [Bdellovibrionales bacterium]|nr:insulinase family protein [Bdellovibrionales bacterium]